MTGRREIRKERGRKRGDYFSISLRRFGGKDDGEEDIERKEYSDKNCSATVNHRGQCQVGSC